MKRERGILYSLIGAMAIAGSGVFLAGTAGAMTFMAKGERVTVQGTTNGDSLEELENILATYPQVRVIVLDKVEGSDDDSTNLRMAQLIRSRGLQTHLASQSVIESGGIELFMGGVKRTMEHGARIGVHSWIDEDTGYEGRDLPADHADHREYLDAYRSLGVPEALYWFILKAAPSTAMYFLNDDEIKRFSVLTAPIAVDALHDNSPGQVTGFVEGAGDKSPSAIHALAPGDADEDDDDDDNDNDEG